MSKYGGLEESEEDVLAPKEPQVTSQDPEERKLARGIRIKRRQEALKRTEQATEEIILEEEPGPTELATSIATEELQRLQLDGAAKVTNVKVTTDEREVIRRTELFDSMQELMKKIELEANEAQIQYEVISSNWGNMLEIKDPLDIDNAMKEQKQKCDALLQQKDELITELKNELKAMDQSYNEDLEKQDNDIKELSERIEKQLTIMQKAYQKQLFLIEQAISIESEAMVDHNNRRWEALYKQRDREEVAHMEYRAQQLEEHKQEMENIMWDHHEKYREAKMELETLIQELQRELEKLKAICLINTEKIGYNYQVLKKREEENVFVRSQQKRKLNKMSDIANNLRKKIKKVAEEGAIEEMRAETEIGKLMQAMADLEKKSEHFSRVNNYKFTQVWLMSAQRCAELTDQIRQAEVALHAQVLAEPPPAPPPFPPKSPLSKYEREIEEKRRKPNPDCRIDPEEGFPPEVKETKDKLVRHILNLLADNTGFLVEDRLMKLISKYKLTSRNLCTLDSIFLALEIQAEDDIELLCKTFLSYAFCPLCNGMEVGSEVMEPTSTVGDRGSMRTRPSIAMGRVSISPTTTRSAGHVVFRSGEATEEEKLMLAEAEEILQKVGDPQDMTSAKLGSTTEGGSGINVRRGRGVTVTHAQQAKQEAKPIVDPFQCPLGHLLEIEPMQVLQALSEFISVFIPPEKQKLNDILHDLKPPDFTTASRLLTEEDIENYWSQWKNMFTPEKDKFWDGLLMGLNNYLPLLQVGHLLEIEPMQVLQALSEFISVFIPPEKQKLNDILHDLKPPDFTTASRLLTEEDIENYWSQWKNMFTPEKDKFWDGLLMGLNNYLPLLQERLRVHEEVVQLRNRNLALRRLAYGALPDIEPMPPKYARPYPKHFACTTMDDSPEAFIRFPPLN